MLKTPPDGKTHNQVDHVFQYKRWHTSIVAAQSFRGADCDTDHYLKKLGKDTH
jgi:hypothetical protein